MKKSNSFTLNRLFFIVLTTFLFVKAQPVKIVLIPFNIPEDTTLIQLQNGIYELLSARLTSTHDSIHIINKDSVNEAVALTQNFTGETGALMLGARLHADYVIQGALSAADSLIEIEAYIIDVSSKKEPFTLKESVPDRDKVIPTVNRFATHIIESFLNEEQSDATTEKTEPDTAETDTISMPPVDTTKKEKDEAQTDSAVTKPAISAAFKKTDTTARADQAFWKSGIYPINIIGLALADIDKDGKNELFVLTPKMLQTYRYENGALVKIADVNKFRFKYPISLDIGDVNGNGSPEVIISALDSYQKGLSSLILEYKGVGYTVITRSLHYYLRIVPDTDSAYLLLGQRHVRNDPFKGSIYRMKWHDAEKEYVPDKELLSNKGLDINLMGLTYGDILDNNEPLFIAYDNTNTILIVNQRGEVLGESEEKLGGSNLYYKVEEGFASEGSNIYLPMRLHIRDIDSDGKKEIIAVKNYDATRNIFGKVRILNKFHIEVFKWDGMVLTPRFKTGIMPKFVRDFVIGDFDNDGKDEILAAVVHREGKLIFAKPKSSFIALELE